MSKLGRFACASLLLSIVGCEDAPSGLEPDDFDDDDAGQVVEPVTPEQPIKPVEPKHDAAVNDAGAVDAGAKKDGAVVDAAAVDAAVDAGTVVDSATPEDASTPQPVTFARVYEVITASCVGCHGAGKTLDLSTPELAHQQLVGIEAQYAACLSDAGASPVRVVAGDPGASLLIGKLKGTQTCGKQMPPKALLAEEQVALFSQWVADGAHAQ